MTVGNDKDDEIAGNFPASPHIVKQKRKKKKINKNSTETLETTFTGPIYDETTDSAVTTQDEGRLSRNKKRARFDSDIDGHREANSILEEDENEDDFNITTVEEEELYLSSIENCKLSRFQRERLFLRGKKWSENKERDITLKCFLACLSKLDDQDGFDSLAECLHEVAAIFAEKGEYEKAVQFVQAEKLFYETALVDTAQLQTQLERQRKPGDDRSIDEDKPDAIRAEEYEHLARLCLEKEQPYLALEYQGKATKLRQQIFGDKHQITVKSLDFFTCIYGEVGKQQYSETLEKVKHIEVDDESAIGMETELRNRKRNGIENDDDFRSKSDRIRKEVLQQERLQEIKQQEEWISHALLLVLFVIAAIVMVCAGAFIYCRVTKNSRLCSSISSDLQYAYMRSKYLYYHYVKYSPQKNVMGA